MVFAVLSLILAAGVFIDSRTIPATTLATDQITLIGMCMIDDSPEVFEGDMLAEHPECIRFYTPSFMALQRVFAGPERDYRSALNVMFALTTLVWLWGWWLALSRVGNPWWAAVLALAVRVPLGPPGGGAWGATDIWWMQPHTVAAALVPWVLWVWLRWGSSTTGWLATGWLCGCMANVHPPTAPVLVGGVLAAETVRSFMRTRRWAVVVVRLALGGSAVLIGALPYIALYARIHAEAVPADPAALARAVALRLPEDVFDPRQAWARAVRPSGIGMIVLPWMLLWALPRAWRKPHRGVIAAMAGFAAGCLLTVAAAFAAEAVLHARGSAGHMAFQLARGLKWLLVPSVVLTAVMGTILIRKVEARFRRGRVLLTVAAIAAVLLTLGASLAGLPGAGLRGLWPSWGLTERTGAPRNEWAGIDPLLPWMAANMPRGARVVGPGILRVEASLPVVHDVKSAGALLHSSPAAMIAWGEREQAARAAAKEGTGTLATLYRSWGAAYWVTTNLLDRPPLHAAGGWYIHALDRSERLEP